MGVDNSRVSNTTKSSQDTIPRLEISATLNTELLSALGHFDRLSMFKKRLY